MALQDMPLSDLQSAVSLNGTDLFYVVQSGESKKVTLAVMVGNKADLENGLVPLRELPNSVVMVANDTERFALDSGEVNDGFIVLQYDSTHPEIAAKMFLVIDNTNLDSEAGYQPFAADAIWGNIINRPTNLAYLAGDDEELPSVSPVLRESSLQNNLVTTLPNYPLDARQGKVLDDKISLLNSNLLKCVVLSAPVGCTYQDSNTIGYRTQQSERVDITSLSGYPSSATVIAKIPYSINSAPTVTPAIVDERYVYCSSRNSGTYTIRVVILYI